MAPREDVPSSLPGIHKYPSYRDDPHKSGDLWLLGKREDDGAETLWRVHDGLYDFTAWIDIHPGGSEWLELTKGTDITEAFESHHVSLTAGRLLKTYYVREASSPRNSPCTFKEDGFYRTLKGRVREVLKKAPNTSNQSRLIADLLASSTLATAVAAAAIGSYYIAFLSGLFLTMTTICSHNFFHQRNNFRMYYFDLSLMSSRDWRITHALSHHMYPNSIHDLEISMFEPVFQWLPQEKSMFARYASWIYSPLVYSLVYHVQLILRLALVRKGIVSSLRKQDAIGLIIPAAMFLLGGAALLDVLLMWSWIILVSSFFFGLIGLNGGHHHPDVFHDGDAPRADLDWGLFQLDTVRDRKEISSNLFLVLTNFGHHALHHLFPTVDHARLSLLYPTLKQTCKEFGMDFQSKTVWEMLLGQFRQLSRIHPNPKAPGITKS